MSAKQSNPTILVVDNEPLVVEELVEYLQVKGYSCIGATTPIDAINTFQNTPSVNIILSDFQMPAMTGVQLVEMLKAVADPNRFFEAIIFTGNAEKDDVISALRAGVADYYQKPVNLEMLLDGLQRVTAKLEQRAAQSQIHMLSHNLQALSSSLSEICGRFNADSVLSGEQEKAQKKQQMPPEVAPVSASTLLTEKLSPRQREVALLIAKGYTNYQIACELGISENTVKIYVSQILRTFNLSNRTQLAVTLESGPDSDGIGQGR